MNLDSLILDNAIPNQLPVFGAAGEIENFAGWSKNIYGGIDTSLTISPDDSENFYSFNNTALRVNPISDSESDTLAIDTVNVEIDTDNDGFDFGRIVGRRTFFYHDKTSPGQLLFNELNGSFFGPSLEQIEYLSIYSQFAGSTEITNAIIGINYAPNFDPTVVFGNSYSQAFNDTFNAAGVGTSHTSLNASPTFGEMPNNKNYTGVNVNPTIPLFTGNGNVTGIGVYGQYGTFENGGFNGININPNITEAQYAFGISVSMDNAGVNPGAPAEVTIQNIEYTASQNGALGNTVSFEYTGGGTAGSEVVSGSFPTFQVQIEDGVSTADQIKAALDAYGPLATVLNTTIVGGPGTTPQVIQAQTFLAGGIDAGSKRAAFLDGDVEITGSLTFGGALSIGQLNSFYMQTLVDGGGNPASLNSLISMPTLPANTTVNNADTIGLNTACLINIGDNSTVNTGFLGISALALPAVASLGANAYVDRVAGASFALSLDGGAGVGSVIDNLDLCRALAIPNGITTVNRMAGFKMDLPFGNPATDAWGVYISPDIPSFFAGAIKIGDTDVPTNSSVGLEIQSSTKAFLPSRMTTTERDALNAVNGMVLYNTTTDKLQCYAAGAWTDLH